MAATLAPLLLASGYIVAQQPLGVLAVVYFQYGSNIDNVMAYDPVNFLNLPVRNDQFVHKGDILFVIDQDRYRFALEDAEATESARLAQYQMLQQQYQRRSKLTLSLSITAEDLENSQRQTESAYANYQQATASRATAALNLKRTEVRATVNGFVTNLNLVKGNYASPANAVLALIDSDSYRVDAYFEETKIPQIRPGSTVDIRLMDGADGLRGTVESIARGITRYDYQDGPELLTYVNPTFTWVRLAAHPGPHQTDSRP
jgi:multidrug resistance efflux pump